MLKRKVLEKLRSQFPPDILKFVSVVASDIDDATPSIELFYRNGEIVCSVYVGKHYAMFSDGLDDACRMLMDKITDREGEYKDGTSNS